VRDPRPVSHVGEKNSFIQHGAGRPLMVAAMLTSHCHVMLHKPTRLQPANKYSHENMLWLILMSTLWTRVV